MKTPERGDRATVPWGFSRKCHRSGKHSCGNVWGVVVWNSMNTNLHLIRTDCNWTPRDNRISGVVLQIPSSEVTHRSQPPPPCVSCGALEVWMAPLKGLFVHITSCSSELAGWPLGWLAADWLAGWLAAGWLAGWPAGWLAG